MPRIFHDNTQPQIELRAGAKLRIEQAGFGMLTGEIVTKAKSLLPIVILLISAFYGVPSLTPRARASTMGLVCIADQSLNPTDCPAEPANLTGNVGDNITVAVNIQGSDSLNAFEIS